MGNNLGKWFYLNNRDKTTKPSLHDRLRLMNMRDVDGETVCDTEIAYSMVPSDDCLRGPVVTADYLLNNYSSVAPQLVVYWVRFKDAPVFDSLYIIIEPYNLEDKECMAAALSVYPALSFPDCADYYVFACHKRMDAIEYFKDMKGYKEYEAGPPGAVYYNDKWSTILSLALNKWCKARSYGWWWAQRLLIENRDTFAKLANIEIPEIMHKRNLCIRALGTRLQAIQRIFLNLMPISNREIDSLCNFVQRHDLNRSGCLQALTKLLRFEAKSDDISEDEVVKDLVFQKSIIVMTYSMMMDLEKIKSNNRLYTLVLAQTTDYPMAVYVIMYRRAPVEFRQPQQTGFSQDEIAKLLK